MKNIKLKTIKIRKTWTRSPVTKVKPSDKIYNRKKVNKLNTKEIE
jgi:hypothetical protein